VLNQATWGLRKATGIVTGNGYLPNYIAVNVGSSVSINGTSNVVLANVQGSNGVVHVIDEVLLPPAK